MKYPQMFAVLIAVLALIMAVFGGAASARPQQQATSACPNMPKRLCVGVTSPAVALLQRYLDESSRGDFYNIKPAAHYDNVFGPYTKAALMRWQKSVPGTNVTGWIDVGGGSWQILQSEATAKWRALGVSKTSLKLARQHHLVIDASKDALKVYVLKVSKYTGHIYVAMESDSSFGGFISGKDRPTSNGTYKTYSKKGKNFRSNQWKLPDGQYAPMPWATFFHGGEAFHQDPPGPSHGCIHIPDMAKAKYIHDLPLGTYVVVHK